MMGVVVPLLRETKHIVSEFFGQMKIEKERVNENQPKQPVGNSLSDYGHPV